jgi:hypothetical protein
MEEPSLTGIPYLAMGNNSLTAEGSWRFCVSGLGCSEYLSHEARSLFALASNEKSHSIVAEDADRGFFGPSEDVNTFTMLSNGSLVPAASFNSIASTLAATADLTVIYMHQHLFSVQRLFDSPGTGE